MNNQNLDLKTKVTDLELSRTAIPQTVDKKGVVHKLKSGKAGAKGGKERIPAKMSRCVNNEH